MLLLAGPMGLMPQATLAAVVIVYSVGLIQLAGIPGHPRGSAHGVHLGAGRARGRGPARDAAGYRRRDRGVGGGAGPAGRDPPVYVLGRKPGTTCSGRVGGAPRRRNLPGTAALRVEGRIFFLNAARSASKIRPLVRRVEAEGRGARPERRLRSRVHGAQGASIEAEQRLRENGVSVWLVGLTPGVLEVVQRSALAKRSGASGCTSTWRSRCGSTWPRSLGSRRAKPEPEASPMGLPEPPEEVPDPCQRPPLPAGAAERWSACSLWRSRGQSCG